MGKTRSMQVKKKRDINKTTHIASWCSVAYQYNFSQYK